MQEIYSNNSNNQLVELNDEQSITEECQFSFEVLYRIVRKIVFTLFGTPNEYPNALMSPSSVMNYESIQIIEEITQTPNISLKNDSVHRILLSPEYKAFSEKIKESNLSKREIVSILGPMVKSDTKTENIIRMASSPNSIRIPLKYEYEEELPISELSYPDLTITNHEFESETNHVISESQYYSAVDSKSNELEIVYDTNPQALQEMQWIKAENVLVREEDDKTMYKDKKSVSFIIPLKSNIEVGSENITIEPLQELDEGNSPRIILAEKVENSQMELEPLNTLKDEKSALLNQDKILEEQNLINSSELKNLTKEIEVALFEDNVETQSGLEIKLENELNLNDITMEEERIKLVDEKEEEDKLNDILPEKNELENLTNNLTEEIDAKNKNEEVKNIQPKMSGSVELKKSQNSQESVMENDIKHDQEYKAYIEDRFNEPNSLYTDTAGTLSIATETFVQEEDNSLEFRLKKKALDIIDELDLTQSGWSELGDKNDTNKNYSRSKSLMLSISHNSDHLKMSTGLESVSELDVKIKFCQIDYRSKRYLAPGIRINCKRDSI